MESSKEKIEAQLCAYVEGELDDAQRAEIEQHLTANPQHKALIAELRAASGLLRDLPRVKAPIELNESFCGQIERSSLLDPIDEHAKAGLGVNRWPHFTAVAAVLLLAVGLGLVVYYVLPPAGGSAGHGQLADADKKLKLQDGLSDTALGDRDGDGRLADETGKEAKGKDLASGATTNMLRSKDGANRDEKQLESARDDGSALGTTTDKLSFGQRAPQRALEDLNVARLRGTGDRGLVTPAEVESLRKWMNDSLGADNNFFNAGGGANLYLVVSTKNAAAANTQLASYFKGNQIQYMEEESRNAGPTVTGLAAGGRDSPVLNGRAYGLNASSVTGEKLAYGDNFATNSTGGGIGGGGGRGGAAGVGGGAGLAVTLDAEQKLKELSTPAAIVPSEQPSTPAPTSSTARVSDPSKLKASVDDTVAGKAIKEEALSQPDQKRSLAKDRVAAGEPAVDRPAAKTDPLGETWELRPSAKPTAPSRLADDNGLGRNTVILARMNRRQAQELSVALSREEGQRAELKEFAPIAVDVAISQGRAAGVPAAPGAAATAALGAESGGVIDPSALTLGSGIAPSASKPAAQPAATDAANPVATPELRQLNEGVDLRNEGAMGRVMARAAAATRPVDAAKKTQWDQYGGSFGGGGRGFANAPTTQSATNDALHLKIDPMDEPVDVVIVVQGDSGTVEAPIKPTDSK